MLSWEFKFFLVDGVVYVFVFVLEVEGGIWLLLVDIWSVLIGIYVYVFNVVWYVIVGMVGLGFFVMFVEKYVLF